MEIYNAIMAAADHIEQNPSLWFFKNVRVPDCNTPACAVGWIGHFAGINSGLSIQDVCPLLNVRSDMAFYEQVDTVGVHLHSWTEPAEVARGLRLYAARYHPLRTGLPDSVREIFTVKEGA